MVIRTLNSKYPSPYHKTGSKFRFNSVNNVAKDVHNSLDRSYNEVHIDTVCDK